MNGIVGLVRTLTAESAGALYVVAAVALGFYCISRGRKAAAAEQAEESRERQAA